MPALVGFGVLLLGLGTILGDAAAQSQHAVDQVDVLAPQGAQLTAASAGRHGEPDQGAPARVLPRFPQQLRRLRRRWRLWIRARRGWRFGLADGVTRHPAPLDRAIVGT